MKGCLKIARLLLERLMAEGKEKRENELEIKKHIASCKECRKFFQELNAEIAKKKKVLT